MEKEREKNGKERKKMEKEVKTKKKMERINTIKKRRRKAIKKWNKISQKNSKVSCKINEFH